MHAKALNKSNYLVHSTRLIELSNSLHTTALYYHFLITKKKCYNEGFSRPVWPIFPPSYSISKRAYQAISSWTLCQAALSLLFHDHLRYSLNFPSKFPRTFFDFFSESQITFRDFIEGVGQSRGNLLLSIGE